MRAGDELSRDGIVGVGVWEARYSGGWRIGGQLSNSRCDRVTSGDKVGAAVPASKAFAYDLRGQTKVGRTAGATEVGSVTAEELGLSWGRSEFRGRNAGSSCRG